jgi:hypothetical protein
MPGHIASPLTCWSITISATKGDVDRALLPALEQFLKEFCQRGGFATEVGSRAFRFHFQGLIEIRCPNTPEHKVHNAISIASSSQLTYYFAILIRNYLQDKSKTCWVLAEEVALR